MKTKFLSIIIGLFATSIAFTSCLSTTDPVSYEGDSTLKSFSFDSIKIDNTHFALGRKHPFSIEQKGPGNVSLIYNVDSLPMKTNLSKVKLNIGTSGYVTYVNKNGKDTIWTSADSINMTSPMNITVSAYNSDGTIVKRIYRLDFRVHKQEPDSLNWGNRAVAINTGITGKQKSVILNGNVYTFQDNNAAQLTVSTSAESDGKSWTVLSPITGIADKADYSSITVFNGKLYILAAGKVYASTDAVAWTQQSGLGADVDKLLVAFDGKLAGTKLDGGVLKFCVTTDGLTWAIGDNVPSKFPVARISATSYALKTNSNLKYALIVGDESDPASLVTIPWSTSDGKTWADLKFEKKTSDLTDYSLPITKNMSVIYYNDKFYAFGGQDANSFDSFYVSKEGIIWKKVTSKVMFPAMFKGRGDYSCVIDGNHFIWMIWSGTGAMASDNIWKGRINSLGFKAN